MNASRTFRLVLVAACVCALIFGTGSSASQGAGLDDPRPDVAIPTPPVNPNWTVSRIASHWLTSGWPPNSNGSHSFELDGQGIPHIVYGADKLYHAYYVVNSSSWTWEVVDDYRGGVSDASFAFDSSNNPSASYCRQGTPSGYNPLMFALHSHGSWQLTVVDNSAGACGSTSIAYDSSGNPHIAYFSSGAHEIRFATRVPLFGWQHSTVATGIGGTSGGVNLVIDSSNTYHISYQNDTDHSIYYVKSHSGGWDTPIRAGGSVRHYNSLAVDSNLIPHLVYVRDGGDLVYASLSDNLFYEAVIRASSSDEYYYAVSLALDSNDQPQIGYYDTVFVNNVEQDYIGYAYKEGGTIWVPVRFIQITPTAPYVNIDLTLDGYPRFVFLSGVSLVYCPGTCGGYSLIDDAALYIPAQTSLVIDNANRMRISYYDGRAGDLMRAIENPPTSWLKDIMDTGEVGSNSSEALSPDGSENIAYYDAANGDLKLVADTGGGFETITVDSGGTADVGRYVSLKMDSNGRWHMSYYDATNQDLKYAYFDGNFPWHVTTVDATGDVGKYSSLVLDDNDYPHIAYYDETNGSVKYAYQDGSGWHFYVIEAGTVNDPAGVGVSLAATPGGFAVAYIVFSVPSAIHYRSCLILFGGTTCFWLSVETVSTHANVLDDFGESTGVSLAVDKSGKPYISFQTLDWFLALASKTGSTWSVETVDANDLSGAHSSLAFDRYGLLHISYVDQRFNSLLVAVQKAKLFLPAIKK